MRHPNSGYTLIGLLVAISVLVIASTATLSVAEFAGRRASEAELIEIGGEFNRAFRSYYEQSPVGTNKYPASLADLARDPRYVSVMRHIRRVYRDPFTANDKWGTIASPQGGIMGVYSLAEGEPIMSTKPYTAQASLSAVTASASNTAAKPAPQGAQATAHSGYANWKFGYVPESRSSGIAKPAPAASAKK